MPDTKKANPETIAKLAPSTARFWSALVIITAFGALLLWIAATGAAGTAIGTIISLVSSALAFYAATVINKIKNRSLILTRDGLFDDQGTALCKMENIESLDRSFFAFKPSNGFVIKLKSKTDRAWVPGLWWRYGKRVGVGGVTSVAQAKAMADTLTLLLNGGSELFPDPQSPFAR